MSEKAKIEGDIDEYLAVFKALFEKIMKARDGTHKWSEVLKDRDQLRKVARFMYSTCTSAFIGLYKEKVNFSAGRE